MVEEEKKATPKNNNKELRVGNGDSGEITLHSLPADKGDDDHSSCMSVSKGSYMMKDSSVWSSSAASDNNDEMFVEDATVGVTDLEDDDDSDDDCSLEDSYDEEVANVHEFENELQKKT